MGKRKRTGGSGRPNPDVTPAETDDAPKADMAHVSPDALAGSPDIFARTPDADEASEVEPAVEPPADVSDETAAAPLGATSGQELVATPPPTPPPPSPPPAPAEPMYGSPAAARQASSSVALGIVLVVLGLFFLLVRVLNVDLSTYGWPLFIIIPGLTLIVVGFVSLGTGALIPGAILTMVGLILAYQSSTGDWPAWAYAWPLVAPGGVGVGIYLQGLRVRNPQLLRQGRTLMFVAVFIFMIGFILFETILNISGIDYGWFGKAALPALLIGIGIILLVRSVQRSRQS